MNVRSPCGCWCSPVLRTRLPPYFISSLSVLHVRKRHKTALANTANRPSAEEQFLRFSSHLGLVGKHVSVIYPTSPTSTYASERPARPTMPPLDFPVSSTRAQSTNKCEQNRVGRLGLRDAGSIFGRTIRGNRARYYARLKSSSK